jgi:monomeric sarcosine oxidase
MADRAYDVAVIGAGVFGSWIARQLQRAGRSVILVDAYGPSNNRGSSGGESRIIRMGYGKDEIYTRWSNRSLGLWKEFFQLAGEDLFRPTGVLGLAAEGDTYVADCDAVLGKAGVRTEKLARQDLAKRFPQFALDGIAWGLFEPDSGVLMARRAVQALVRQTLKDGAGYLQGAVLPPAGEGRLKSVETRKGEGVSAGMFVFACGPWLPKLFPDLVGGRISPTCQEIFFFGTPAGDARFQPPAFPTWLYLADEVYGMPDLENRGMKISFHDLGPAIDPDAAERVVSPQSLLAMRAYVGRRFPALKDAPVVESRVCQYANTSTGDFLIDRHPAFQNVWLVGGGSGHGFKHGPALGEYVAARILEGGEVDPRFSLATKATLRNRTVL